MARTKGGSLPNRFAPGTSGCAPRTQTLRRPFFSRTVVIVAVDTPESVSIAFLSSIALNSAACGLGAVTFARRPGEVNGEAIGQPRPVSSPCARVCAGRLRKCARAGKSKRRPRR